MRSLLIITGKSLLSLLPVCMILFILLIDSRISRPGRFEASATISEAVLTDSLPVAAVQALHAKFRGGYRLQSGPFNTYFYWYEADHDRVLSVVAHLPQLLTNTQGDLQCLLANQQEAQKWPQFQEALSGQQLTFTLPDAIDQYVGFKCLKPPYAHHLLLDTRSKSVIHIVEQVM